ncbi:MAG TPA: tetratricopeptide repeat protein [Blastocatellia bacterium]|nr:tetratricopeptide repeat protein [Blastocatellia bacterium]
MTDSLKHQGSSACVPCKPSQLVLSTFFLASALFLMISTALATAWQPGFTLDGSVWLPDGKLAQRVIVRVTNALGMTQDVYTDTAGHYQVQLPIGRYKLTALNPQERDQYSDPAEAEGLRVGTRINVHLYLKLPSTPTARESRSAVVSLAEATQKVPKDARKAFDQGVRQRADKQLERALVSLGRAIELYPEYFQAFSERGEVHINLGRINEAAGDFDNALKLNENYEPALRGAGYCRIELQKFNDAIGFFERAILVDPNSVESHLFLGVASYALGRHEPARNELQLALRLDAQRAATAHIYLSNILVSEQRYKEAADELHAYVGARPNAADAEKWKAKEAELRKRSKAK